MNLLENYTLAELNPGVTATYSKTLSYVDVVLFARCSGDVNPIHLDAEYAATTAFGEPIGHRMCTGAHVSPAIATRLPGPGPVDGSQHLNFNQPVNVAHTATEPLNV